MSNRTVIANGADPVQKQAASDSNAVQDEDFALYPARGITLTQVVYVLEDVSVAAQL